MIDVFERLKEKRREDERHREAAEGFFGKSRERKFCFPVHMKDEKPICPWCDKKFGVRDTNSETKRYPVGTPIPRYNGNIPLVEEKISVGPGMGPNHEPGCAVDRTTWNGTYRAKSGTDPFCTTTCALAFAQASYQGGFRKVKR